MERQIRQHRLDGPGQLARGPIVERRAHGDAVLLEPVPGGVELLA